MIFFLKRQHWHALGERQVSLKTGAGANGIGMEETNPWSWPPSRIKSNLKRIRGVNTKAEMIQLLEKSIPPRPGERGEKFCAKRKRKNNEKIGLLFVKNTKWKGNKTKENIFKTPDKRPAPRTWKEALKFKQTTDPMKISERFHKVISKEDIQWGVSTQGGAQAGLGLLVWKIR